MKRHILRGRGLAFSTFLGLAIVCPAAQAQYTWTEQTNSGSRNWWAITSSADGAKLAAANNGGYIYTSTDSGATWTERAGSGARNWCSMASSADGTKLAAGNYGGYIYTSTDYGATWTEQTNAGARNWFAMASSSDGTKLAACNWNGYIYTSTDSGATWTGQSNAGARNWRSMASSADGTKLAACNWNGYIYTSTDSGATWTERTNAGVRPWYAITSSADGTMLAACDLMVGYIYTSTDSGATWTEQTNAGSRSWYGIASSSDGTKLAAAANDMGGGYIYTAAPATAPTVTTTAVSNVTTTTADSGGNVTADGGDAVTARGVCWSTSANPTTADDKTTDGSGTGVFTSNLTGLSPGTTYYVAAYATNSVGTAYGADVTFATVAEEPEPEPEPELAPDLRVTIEAQTDADALVGDDVAFTATVENVGTATATGVVLTIPIPENAEFVSARLVAGQSAQVTDPVVTEGDEFVTLEFGDVPAGDSLQVEIVLRVIVAGEVVVNASATSEEITTPKAAETAATIDAEDEYLRVVETTTPLYLCGALGLAPLLVLFGLIGTKLRHRRRGR